MTRAFVVGNGVSRQAIALDGLKTHGRVYGCNALYREWTPDVLVAADKAISEQIQHSGYANNNVFYTRRPINGLGARRIPEPYWGFSSGQIALALAAIDKCSPIFLLGFDLGSVNDRFNNVYADTEFYKKSSARPTYSGNWIRQILQVAKDFPHCKITRVAGSATAVINEFDKIINIDSMNIDEFKDCFGV